MTPQPPRANSRVSQSSSRQHAVGRVRAPRRRHLRHDRVQGGNDVDAAHPRRARARTRAAAREPERALAVDRRPLHGDRSNRCWRVSRRSVTAVSSRAISRPTGCGSSRRRSTSSSGATRATCSCRSSTTTPRYTDLMYDLFNDADRPGPEFPRCPATPRELWPRWISEGWFDWEPDGWPFWSHHHHLSTWWEVRDLPNVLVRPLRRPEGRPRSRDAPHRRVLRHRRRRGRVARARRDRRPRRHAHRSARHRRPDGSSAFEGGAARFFYKGDNGRWRGVLTDDDLALYDTAAATLDPTLRQWLEHGGHAGLRRKSWRLRGARR